MLTGTDWSPILGYFFLLPSILRGNEKKLNWKVDFNFVAQNTVLSVSCCEMHSPFLTILCTVLLYCILCNVKAEKFVEWAWTACGEFEWFMPAFSFQSFIYLIFVVHRVVKQGSDLIIHVVSSRRFTYMKWTQPEFETQSRLLLFYSFCVVFWLWENWALSTRLSR